MLGLVLALDEQPTKSEVVKQRSSEVTTKSETGRNLSSERSWRKSTRRCIGDLTEDRWAARAGRQWKVGWTLMECFVGHQGEGEGFFRGGGDAEVVGGDDLYGIGGNRSELA